MTCENCVHFGYGGMFCGYNSMLCDIHEEIIFEAVGLSVANDCKDYTDIDTYLLQVDEKLNRKET